MILSVLGDGLRQPYQDKMQVKSIPPVHNGPGQMYQPPSSGVNGYPNGQQQPASFPNGPVMQTRFSGDQFNQPPRPGMPPYPGQGQFRPPLSTTTSLGSRPPMSGAPIIGQPIGPPRGAPPSTYVSPPPRVDSRDSLSSLPGTYS